MLLRRSNSSSSPTAIQGIHRVAQVVTIPYSKNSMRYLFPVCLSPSGRTNIPRLTPLDDESISLYLEYSLGRSVRPTYRGAPVVRTSYLYSRGCQCTTTRSSRQKGIPKRRFENEWRSHIYDKLIAKQQSTSWFALHCTVFFFCTLLMANQVQTSMYTAERRENRRHISCSAQLAVFCTCKL